MNTIEEIKREKEELEKTLKEIAANILYELWQDKGRFAWKLS